VTLLLDTCAFLWLTDQTEFLSKRARVACEDTQNSLWLHQASALEIQIKFDLGKLPLKLPPREFIPLAVKRHGLNYASLGDETIWFLQKLPLLHRDPFDRLLIAYALTHGLTLVTPDPQIQQYPLPVLW
jgi:PIN domain nuclease of toxin-antitoxin system